MDEKNINTVQVVLRCYNSGAINADEAEMMLDQIYGYIFIVDNLSSAGAVTQQGSAVVLDPGQIHGENDRYDDEDVEDKRSARRIGFKMSKQK